MAYYCYKGSDCEDDDDADNVVVDGDDGINDDGGAGCNDVDDDYEDVDGCGDDCGYGCDGSNGGCDNGK